MRSRNDQIGRREIESRYMHGNTADHRGDKQEWIKKTQSKDADRNPKRQQKCEIVRANYRMTNTG